MNTNAKRCPVVAPKPDRSPNVAGLALRLSSPIQRVSYHQAEASSKSLAAQLSANFGRGELTRFGYMAIPRGGHFVLAMLTYVLDIGSRQLLQPPTDAPIVVVDDCALTGSRFRQVLQLLSHERVIFAHLYSHPALRQAITTQEPRVMTCLAAHDLNDLACERFPNEDEYSAWLERWRQRLPGPRYWIGMPEIVLFPWSEPDRPAWNPWTEEVENKWRLAAPDRCLKNWAYLGMPPRTATSVFRSPDAVAFRIDEDKVTLCDLRTDKVYGLEGVGADMWRALVAYGDLDTAADYLLARFDVDASRLRVDLCSFANDLLATGLLEPVNASGDATR